MSKISGHKSGYKFFIAGILCFVCFFLKQKNAQSSMKLRYYLLWTGEMVLILYSLNLSDNRDVVGIVPAFGIHQEVNNSI
jgi:hypothetical protein